MIQSLKGGGVEVRPNKARIYCHLNVAQSRVIINKLSVPFHQKMTWPRWERTLNMMTIVLINADGPIACLLVI